MTFSGIPTHPVKNNINAIDSFFISFNLLGLIVPGTRRRREASVTTAILAFPSNVLQTYFLSVLISTQGPSALRGDSYFVRLSLSSAFALSITWMSFTLISSGCAEPT